MQHQLELSSILLFKIKIPARILQNDSRTDRTSVARGKGIETKNEENRLDRKYSFDTVLEAFESRNGSLIGNDK